MRFYDCVIPHLSDFAFCQSLLNKYDDDDDADDDDDDDDAAVTWDAGRLCCV